MKPDTREKKRWTFTFRIEPGELEGTVSGRFGQNLIFCAFSTLTGWWWVYPGGMQRIEEPQMLYLDPAWAREHPRKSPAPRRENPIRMRKQKVEQLCLL
jgi:hypothetical protein